MDDEEAYDPDATIRALMNYIQNEKARGTYPEDFQIEGVPLDHISTIVHEIANQLKERFMKGAIIKLTAEDYPDSHERWSIEVKVEV